MPCFSVTAASAARLPQQNGAVNVRAATARVTSCVGAAITTAAAVAWFATAIWTGRTTLSVCSGARLAASKGRRTPFDTGRLTASARRAARRRDKCRTRIPCIRAIVATTEERQAPAGCPASTVRYVHACFFPLSTIIVILIGARDLGSRARAMSW